MIWFLISITCRPLSNMYLCVLNILMSNHQILYQPYDAIIIDSVSILAQGCLSVGAQLCRLMELRVARWAAFGAFAFAPLNRLFEGRRAAAATALAPAGFPAVRSPCALALCVRNVLERGGAGGTTAEEQGSGCPTRAEQAPGVGVRRMPEAQLDGQVGLSRVLRAAPRPLAPPLPFPAGSRAVLGV